MRIVWQVGSLSELLKYCTKYDRAYSCFLYCIYKNYKDENLLCFVLAITFLCAIISKAKIFEDHLLQYCV